MGWPEPSPRKISSAETRMSRSRGDADVALSRQLRRDVLPQGDVSLLMIVDGQVLALFVEGAAQGLHELVQRQRLGVRVGDGEVVLAAPRDTAGAGRRRVPGEESLVAKPSAGHSISSC